MPSQFVAVAFVFTLCLPRALAVFPSLPQIPQIPQIPHVPNFPHMPSLPNLQDRESWDLTRPAFWKRLIVGQNHAGPDEWEYAQTTPRLNAVVQQMEDLDLYYEQMYQKRVLSDSDVLIIAPLPVGNGMLLQRSHSTLNPVLYNNEDFNVVFKLGVKYPRDKPFLVVYLATCNHRTAPTRKLYPIEAFYYDYSKSMLIPSPIDPVGDHREFDMDLRRRGFKLQQTRDNAFYFKWTVPNQAEAFPSDRYCFVFDMTSVNPSHLPASPSHDLHQRKPRNWTSWFRRKWHYHQIKASSTFRIQAAPRLFTTAWFSRQFGGVDLERFMGGAMHCFKFFDSLFQYQSRAGRWDSDEFYNDLNNRAVKVSKWFSSILDETDYRFKNGYGKRLEIQDSGYSDFEDRRDARMRAIGLLFHPHGAATLKLIGKSLLKVAHEYEVSMSQGGKILDFASELYHRFKNGWKEIFGHFSRARLDLTDWVAELKLIFGDQLPNEKDMLEMSLKLGHGGPVFNKVDIPMSSKQVYAPIYIQDQIMKHMTTLVEHEIQLIVWKMGQLLLAREDKKSKFLDAFIGFSTYNNPKYFAYAAVLKQYGTKFLWMADNFSIFGESNTGNEVAAEIVAFNPWD